MIKIKFNDGTTKVYRNDGIVKKGDFWYTGVENLRIGSRTCDKVVVDIERFNPTLRFISNLAKCCVWCLMVYVAVLLAVI